MAVSAVRDDKDTQVRKMKEHNRNRLETALAQGELWRVLMAEIPCSAIDPTKKYNADEANTIADHCRTNGDHPAKVLLEEWSTTRFSADRPWCPTLGDLRQILETRPDFRRALDVLEDILGDTQRQPILSSLLEDEPVKPQLHYDLLSEKTDHFKYEVGQGAFSRVYKGRLDGQLGRHEPVAVKVLDSNNPQAKAQFHNELDCIQEVREHPNLLSLLAFSDDNPPHLCLVYPFMERGTLHENLWLRPVDGHPLTSRQRLQISMDVTAGLDCLHNDFSLVHRDIKPTNILLDAELRAKIADYGIVRLTPEEVAITQVQKGTPAYMPPEAHHGDVSPKTDVYSFGVVLLNLITSIPATPFNTEDGMSINPAHHLLNDSDGRIDLISYVEDKADDPSQLLDLVDPVFQPGGGVSVQAMLDVALRCLKKRNQRPDIREVRGSLEQTMAG